MPDLHDWITQQVDETERIAQQAASYDDGASHDVAGPEGTWAHLNESEWFGASHRGGVIAPRIGYTNAPELGAHIIRHDPATVLRRCAADRKILAEHAPADGWNPYACTGCGHDDFGPNVDHTNDCPTLQALAEGYGLTEEQRAALDRPEPERPAPTGPGLLPDGLAEQMFGKLYATYLGTRPVEPRPEVKAMEILGPELKKISGYVPISEEQQ